MEELWARFYIVMGGFRELLFFGQRYLSLLLSALPWLLFGVFLEVMASSRWGRFIKTHLETDRVGLSLLFGAAWAAAVPDSLHRYSPGSSIAETHRLFLSRALHPVLLFAMALLLRSYPLFLLYYALFVTVGGLFVGLSLRVVLSSGVIPLAKQLRGKEGQKIEEPTDSLAFGFLQGSYDHSVDLLFGALIGAGMHTLLGSTGVGDMIFLATTLSYLAGAVGSPSPAATVIVAMTLLPVGQPGVLLAYILGSGWGSYLTIGSVARRLGWPAAVAFSLLIMVVSILLSSPISWSTFEVLQ